MRWGVNSMVVVVEGGSVAGVDGGGGGGVGGGDAKGESGRKTVCNEA